MSLRVRRPCVRHQILPATKMDNSFHRRDQAQGVRLAAATELWQRQDTNNNMRFAFSSFACMHRIASIASEQWETRKWPVLAICALLSATTSRHFSQAPDQTNATMANDSLDDMLGWLDEAMGEKDAHHYSPTIAIGRGSKHSAYARSHSCDDEILNGHRHHHARAPPRRQKHAKHAREHDRHDHHDHEQQEEDRRYQRASSYSAIDSREMNVSTSSIFSWRPWRGYLQ